MAIAEHVDRLFVRNTSGRGDWRLFAVLAGTLDRPAALTALGCYQLYEARIEQTLGILRKYQGDSGAQRCEMAATRRAQSRAGRGTRQAA
jgi:hypothetical protein